MKLLLKIIIPLFITLVIVFVATNQLTVKVFKNSFFESKATSLGDHALREIGEIFEYKDFLGDQNSKTLHGKHAQFIKAIRDPSTFRSRIWNRKYQIVYSDLNKIPEHGNLLDKEVKKGFSQVDPISWSIQNPEKGDLDTSYGEYLNVIVPMRDSNGVTHYVLELHVATSGILANVQKSINQTVYFFIAGGVVIFAAFYVIIFFLITKPVKRLMSAMDVVGKGDLSIELVNRSKDEIGALFRHFNEMRVKIKLLTEELVNEKQSVELKVKERTAQLNEEKIKLQSSISSLTVGFIMTDKQNNIITINQTARNILCKSASSPLATVKDCTLAHIEDELSGAIDLRALIERCTRDKKILLVKEVEFQQRFIKIIITPIIEEMESIGAVVLIEDITEEKILNRSKDEFFSIASHELRTPLTAIKGNTSLIKEYYADKISDPELSGMISDIHESSVRLIGIVNDFLNVSRLEQGKMEFKKEEFSLGELVTNSFKDLQSMADEKKLYLKLDDTQKVPNVSADKDKLKEVLINLIGNSLKFTEKGGITVTLSVEDKFVKVLISDTGRGISSANQSLLFRKFQQAGSSILTRDTTKGTGLGLYITKLMVEGMGGAVGLESSVEGKGTTFKFTLPVAPSEKN